MRKLLIITILTIFLLPLFLAGSTPTKSPDPKYTQPQSVVVFTASWCRYCKTMEPYWKYKNIKKVLDENYNFFVVDTDKNPKYAKAYKVSGIPVVVIVEHVAKNKTKEVKRHIGYLSAKNLEKFLTPPKKNQKFGNRRE